MRHGERLGHSEGGAMKDYHPWWAFLFRELVKDLRDLLRSVA